MRFSLSAVAGSGSRHERLLEEEGKPSKASAPKKSKSKTTKPKKVEKKETPVIEEKPKKVAQKPKEKVERKESPPKTVAKPEPLKLGPPPTPMITARHVGTGDARERIARGFSFGELASAGVTINTARHQSLSVDLRRRSVVEQNVEMLKGWLKSSPKK